MSVDRAISDSVRQLLDQGTTVHAPATVHLAGAVDVKRISPEAVIFPGCRLMGALTSIGPGCRLGEEGPLTLDDCQLERNVALKAGYVAGSVFLDGSNVGSAAHVRPGTILEEEASCAHAVGLKQTLLMPFVVTGSLVNFCDCLMAGGTDRRHHSEVGSSYVHFNYTSHNDKATASLLGDVPRGVMLDQLPIFLGGQGGLAGPVRMEFGTTIAAGVICRRDVERQGQLVFGDNLSANRCEDYDPRCYGKVGRKIANNFVYLGNVHALREWYRGVRARFLKRDAFGAACYEGVLRNLDLIIEERRRRLTELSHNLCRSVELGAGTAVGSYAAEPWRTQARFIERWPALSDALKAGISGAGDGEARSRFLSTLDAASVNHGYIETIRQLTPEERTAGTVWLESVVRVVTDLWPAE
jgi:UDP-N-acetylglucosamine/UDP-N-acetylgalactosamine diphosphorylase